MSNFIGMDSDVVRAYAGRLDGQAAALMAVIGQIDGIVHQIGHNWQGPTATEFIGWWQQQHRPKLVRAQSDIAGLAKSATNNADQQDQTSAGSGATGGGWRGAVSGGGSGGGSVVDGRFGSGQLSDGVLLGLLVGTPTTLASSGFDGFRGSRTATHGEGDLGGVHGSYDANAYAGAGASGSAKLTSDGRSLGASAGVAGFVGAGAAANGTLSDGPVQADGSASVFAGAKANADASGSVGLDGAKAHVGAGGFVGARADASGTVDVAGAEVNAGASAEAGLDLHCDVDAAVTLKDISASVDLGAALGVGASFKVGFDVHPEETFHELIKFGMN